MSATTGNGSVSLTWSPSAGATTYNVYRSTLSGAELPAYSGISGTSYTDTGVNNGTPYFYEVTAVNGSGESAFSNEASATPAGSGSSVTIIGNPSSFVSGRSDIPSTFAIPSGSWTSGYFTYNTTDILIGITLDGELIQYNAYTPHYALNSDQIAYINSHAGQTVTAVFHPSGSGLTITNFALTLNP